MKIGLAGCGHLGTRHAEKLAARADLAELLLFDTEPGRARALADRLRAGSVASYHELLERVEAVVIAAPTEVHAELGESALAAGRHVLVEKPITRTLAEADRLLSAARRSGRVLMVGQVERFNPAVRPLEGRLTAPRFIEAHRLAEYKPRSLDIDVVLDLMIHDIDLALHFTRELPFRIEAAGTPVLTGKVDIANARLAFPGGCVANLTASRVSLTRTRKIRFFMPQTYVSLDLAARGANLYRLKPGGAAPATPDAAAGAPADMAAFLERIDHEAVMDDGSDALVAEQSAFLDACRGTSANPVPGEDGRAALAVALEVLARLSEREG